MMHSQKKDKTALITLIGMDLMILAVAVKAATGSVLAAAAIHIAGLAVSTGDGSEAAGDFSGKMLVSDRLFCYNAEERSFREGNR